MLSPEPTTVETEIPAVPDVAQLLALACAGDPDAYGELCQVYETRLLRQAMRLCGNVAMAKDLAQDTLVEAYLSVDRYELGSNFPLWLRSIARNLIRNHYRSLSRRKEAGLLEACLEIEDAAPLPDLPTESLKGCLDKLDDVSRRLVEGFYRNSRTVAELATELGKGASWVKVVLHRIRYRLRDCLTRAGVEGLS